ncbi:MAG: glycosyltransferase family 2 protein [Planktomarina sp.]
MPRASIVVPAYNVEKTIAKTLTSLFAQTFQDFEIIVVDDGCKDGTLTVVDTFNAPNLRIIQQKNRGLAGARNTGIYESTGEFIGFCDSDDLWAPTKLADHIAHLEANPKLGISYSASELIDEQSRPMGMFQSPRLTNIDAAHVFKRNPIGNGSAPVFRRAALGDMAYTPEGGDTRPWWFDETFRQSEDIEAWLRFALTTQWEMEGLATPLTKYRINQSGLSANTDNQLAAWERMVDKLTPLNPDFFKRNAPIARAYQYRYLARRAISDGNAEMAGKWVKKSLGASFKPLWEEPKKTFVTVLACFVLNIIGTGGFDKLQSLVRPKAG